MPDTIKTKVVGVTFQNEDGTDRQEIIKMNCFEGTILRAVPEPDNPRDPDAIGLWVRGKYSERQVGYLKRGLATDVSETLDEGYELHVVILNVTGGGRGESLGLNISLEFVEPEPVVPAHGVQLGGRLTAPPPRARRAGCVIGVLLALLMPS